jgi:hypothetical protein
MEQASTEEVKIPPQQRPHHCRAGGHGCSCPNALRISRGDCAAELRLPSGKAARKIVQRL